MKEAEGDFFRPLHSLQGALCYDWLVDSDSGRQLVRERETVSVADANST